MTATRGRPPVGPALTVRLPDELRSALDARAEAEGIAVAEVVRRILTAVLTGGGI